MIGSLATGVASLIPTHGTVRPIFVGLPESGGWSYFAEKWHPMVSDEHAASYGSVEWTVFITTVAAGCASKFAVM